MAARLSIAAIAALLVVGCDSTTRATDSPRLSPAQRSAKCTERMLARVDDRGPPVRKYIRTAYCDRFAARGWVYPDGTLSIKAHLSLVNGTTCTTSKSGGPTVTKTPCPVDPGDLDCALLHFVRKAEVQAYIRRLQRRGEVKCDDGTPPGDLGA